MEEGEWKSLIQYCKPNGKYWYIGGVCKLLKSDITALMYLLRETNYNEEKKEIRF